MPVNLRTFFCVLLAAVLSIPFVCAAGSDAGAIITPAQGLFWHEPEDISSRDLFYGPGGKEHQPHGPYTFVKEDLKGSNPKYVVRDGNGVQWKVKLGVEARPETVATRVVWAVGYYANEDYFLPDLQIANLPAHLHRGQKLISPDGTMHDVRLKREDEKKTGDWQWRQDPFAGTREWYGLRVLMAVINNWDLKDENNSTYTIYRGGDAQNVYMVSDLGASFGTPALRWPLSKAKGNVESYARSKFIVHTAPTTVDFADPGRPEFVFLLHPRNYFERLHMRWIGRDIPREDARWMGSLLARLSPQQIQDAFRAAGYSAQEIDLFSTVLENRIKQLSEL